VTEHLPAMWVLKDEKEKIVGMAHLVEKDGIVIIGPLAVAPSHQVL
jgi:hypothetical protein